MFLRVFRTVGRFRGQSSLKTWLFRIVVNQARNRQRWWRRRRQGDQVSLDQHVADHGELPSARRRRGARPRPGAQSRPRGRLWQALDRLPFDQRTAIVLRDSTASATTRLPFRSTSPSGTVKSRLTRARQALRTDLQESRL